MPSVTTPGGTALSPLLIRRSITPNAEPQPVLLEEGELAANLKDLILYTKDDQGNIVKLGQNYDAILQAHFQASNPHNVTKSTVGLSNVPNVNPLPLYYYNSGNRTFDTNRQLTRVEYGNGAGVTYTIDTGNYDIGQQFEITRLSRDAGNITVTLTSGNWLIDGVEETDDIQLTNKPFMAILTKAQTDLWTVKVQYI